jgi:hypothetical protein
MECTNESQPGVDCTADPSVAGNAIRCEGWLSLFKTHALTLPCTAFDGTATNCWDVIDALQVHAYAASVRPCCFPQHGPFAQEPQMFPRELVHSKGFVHSLLRACASIMHHFTVRQYMRVIRS